MSLIGVEAKITGSAQQSSHFAWRRSSLVILDPGHNPNKFKFDMATPHIMTPIYEDPEKHSVPIRG
jgi:hypothetical protein